MTRHIRPRRLITLRHIEGSSLTKSFAKPRGPRAGAAIDLSDLIWNEMAEARALTVRVTDDGDYHVSFDIVLDQEARAVAESIGSDQGRGVANIIKRKVKLGLRLLRGEEPWSTTRPNVDAHPQKRKGAR
jgi:hypothetical protein